MVNLLSFFDYMVTEDQTSTVSFISILSLILLVVVLAVICIFNSKNKNQANSKDIVFAGITLASSFTLSFLKISPVLYGGSITLASLMPVLLYAYFFGSVRGLLVGLVYGVLQFIQSPYILTPLTFILDYLLAFACIGFMPLFKKVQNEYLNVGLGVFTVYAARFFMHFISGIIYFANDAVWAESLPATNAFIYSFCYNATYLIPDMIICLIAFLALANQNAIKNLASIIKK